MNNASVAAWKDALLTIPGDNFLDLMRNYLGKVITPYNKHELVSKLESFLHKEETQTNILALCDTLDAAILGALKLLGPTTESKLFDFLSGFTDEATLIERLVNLEERLILFRIKDSNVSLIYVCPLLYALLMEQVARPEILFDSEEIPETKKHELNHYRFENHTLLALLCFALNNERKITAPGKINAKGKELFKEVFQNAKESSSALQFLHDTRLLLQNDSGLKLNFELFEKLKNLSADIQKAYYAISLVSLDFINNLTLAHKLLDTLKHIPKNYSFSYDSIIRFLQLSTCDDIRLLSNKKIVEALTESGCLLLHNKRYSISLFDDASIDPTPLRLSSDFSVTVLKGLPFSSIYILAHALKVTESAAVSRFTLTRESLSYALDSGISLTAIIDLLEALSPSTLPENVAYALGDWQKEKSSLKITNNVVIKADSRLIWMIEHAPAFKSRIIEQLAEGIYVLDTQSIIEAEALMEVAGIRSFELIKGKQKTPEAIAKPDLFSSTIPEYEETTISFPSIFHLIPEKKELRHNSVNALGLSNTFKAMLEKLKETGAISNDGAEAISERIAVNLIISDTQVKEGASRFEKREARGIDFAGKARLLEKILHTKHDYAEVLYKNSKGEPERRLVKPLLLAKTGTTLLLEAQDQQSKELLKIPVERLSLVKRIRASLFG